MVEIEAAVNVPSVAVILTLLVCSSIVPRDASKVLNIKVSVLVVENGFTKPFINISVYRLLPLIVISEPKVIVMTESELVHDVIDIELGSFITQEIVPEVLTLTGIVIST